MHDEELIKQYIRELRQLYKDILVYSCVFIFCLIAWVATGGGFWPLWVMIAFITTVLIKANSLGKLSISDINFWRKHIAFLSPEWEDRQIEKIIRNKKQTSDKNYGQSCKCCKEDVSDESFEADASEQSQKKPKSKKTEK